MTPYQKKLLDPRWQRRRLEVLQSHDWQCADCGDAESTLHVHHPRYIRGREPWEYSDTELVALCVNCHDRHTQDGKRLQELLAANPFLLSIITAMVNGLLAGNFDLDFDPPSSPEIQGAYMAGVAASLLVDSPAFSAEAIRHLRAKQMGHMNPVLDAVAGAY